MRVIRMARSNPSSTRSTKRSSRLISSTISGYSRAKSMSDWAHVGIG